MEEKIVELNKMINELRKKLEEKEAGRITEAQFKEFEEKINKRIDEIEVALRRPAVESARTESNEAKAAFFKYLRTGRIETKAFLVENATGEILVPEQLMADLLRTLPKITTVRPLARVMTINSDRMRKRSISGLSVGWGKLETGATTGATLTVSTLTPSEGYIYVEDLYGLTKIGEDLLADSDVNLATIITEEFAKAIAKAEDDAFIAGTGHASSKPEGVLTASGTISRTTASAGTVDFDDILDLYYAIAAQYRANAVFICHSSTEKELRTLKNNNNYIWSPAVSQGMPNTLFGRPIYTNDAMPEFNAGNKAMIFGDFKNGYLVLDRESLTIQRLNELYAESGLVGFKVHYRVGGGVLDPGAFAILTVSSSGSL